MPMAYETFVREQKFTMQLLYNITWIMTRLANPAATIDLAIQRAA